MKKLLTIAALMLLPMLLLGQDIPDPTITPELMDKPFAEWQLNLTTVLLASMVLGRVLASIRKGGGLKGILAGIWGGTNTPKP